MIKLVAFDYDGVFTDGNVYVLENIAEGVDWTTIRSNDPENKRDDCKDVPTTHYLLTANYTGDLRWGETTVNLGWGETDIGTVKSCPVDDNAFSVANAIIQGDLCKRSKYA